MSTDPRTAPVAAVRLADVAVLGDDEAEGRFHLVRRHFDVRAFGVNGMTGDAGQLVVSPHDEREGSEHGTEGHEELFIVCSGHAVFTAGEEELDAPAGTLVFVRDPAMLRSARALADGTAIVAVGAKPGTAYAISRWEQEIPE